MAYEKTIIAKTKEEALERAEAFKETLSFVQGPFTTYGPLETPEGQWEVRIQYYGFD